MKILEKLLNSLPEVYFKNEIGYWLVISKILTVWKIEYINEKDDSLFCSRSRSLKNAIIQTMNKIKIYNKIT